MRILISAGEASGDLYAARVAEILKTRHPDLELFGCAGPRMHVAGVEQIVDQHSLAVVGIVEVLRHIPRIWSEFKKLERAAAQRHPDLAILTDSPDFHLRLAKKLRRLGIPVVYMIAPQVWAWREGRVRQMRRDLARLLCIFPFEEFYFQQHGVPATYLGHPLAQLVKPALTRVELCTKLGIAESRPILALLPGSRPGEVARHIPDVETAALQIVAQHPEIVPVLALPQNFDVAALRLNANFTKPYPAGHIQTIEHRRIKGAAAIRVVQGHTWDVMAHARVALAASGTVTVEAAMLRLPMVTFYRVNALTWYLGRWLVKAPFLSMVNLVAGRRIVAELIQDEMTAGRISDEALRLLENDAAWEAMRAELDQVARSLTSERDPMEIAADAIEEVLAATGGDHR